MQANIVHFWGTLIGDESQFELHQRVLNFYCLFGILTSVYASIVNYCVAPQDLGLPLGILSTGVMFVCWYLSRILKRSSWAIGITIAMILSVFAPGYWITNGGTNGGAQYFFMVWGLVIFAISNRHRRYIWVIILILEAAALISFEYNYPDLMFHHSSNLNRYLDIGFSLSIGIFLTTGIFGVFAISYDREHRRVKDYVQELQKHTAALEEAFLKLQESQGERDSLAENMNSLALAINGQKHDFINHIQIVKALCDQQDMDAVQDYVDSMCEDIGTVNSFLRINNPYLQALFNSKLSMAVQKGVDLKWESDVNLSMYTDNVFKLVRILGNLINNAIEEVAGNEEANRWVKVVISRRGPFDEFCISNPGSLSLDDPEMAFVPGITTRSEQNSGLGLYISRKLAEEMNGRIQLNNPDGPVISFALLLLRP